MSLIPGDPSQTLPLIFAALMGLSILIYVILDGYDLGVGILMAAASPDEKDRMVASIGPFWDANETWLVLAIGILLVAFPTAHGMILTALYLPVTILLIGLTLRGVAFEFRAKVAADRKALWNRLFVTGSLMATVSQGAMLGLYVMGLEPTPSHLAFSALIAIGLTAAYVLVGAAWLIYKTDGALQKKAVRWARSALVLTAVGMAAISLATPWVSPRIFEKWFSFPAVLALAPLPLATLALFIGLYAALRALPTADDRFAWVPFALTVGIFTLGFAGLAYSFYPYVVPEKLTLVAAAASPESLAIILAGTLVVLPVILIYSGFAYYVFRGKATTLRYD